MPSCYKCEITVGSGKVLCSDCAAELAKMADETEYIKRRLETAEREVEFYKRLYKEERELVNWALERLKGIYSQPAATDREYEA